MLRLPTFALLRCLQAPYTALLDCAAEPLLLGSILILDLIGAEAAIAEAIVWRSRSPWCPLVLIVRNTIASVKAIDLLTQLHGPHAFIAGLPNDAYPPVDSILQAVRTRPVPTTKCASAYVAERVGEASLCQLLQEAVDLVTQPLSRRPVAAFRRISRHLGAYGPLLAPDWRWLFQLARMSGLGQVTVEELARRQGVEARTFRAQVRRYTGVSTECFRAWVGWEWVLEAALRRWGYLDSASSICLAEEA
jgi:hypothetical protein